MGVARTDRLGHGDEERQLLPKLIAALQGKRIVQVAAGAWYSLVLQEGGEPYSFGWGRNGQLGHGDHLNRFLPKLIASTLTRRGHVSADVVEVAAGSCWSTLLHGDDTVTTLGGDRASDEEDGAW